MSAACVDVKKGAPDPIVNNKLGRVARAPENIMQNYPGAPNLTHEEEIIRERTINAGLQ